MIKDNEVEKIKFTKEMKEDYTILIPDMAPIHLTLLKGLFKRYGYNIEILRNEGQSVVDEGLKNVHNDTCYPALLVIGQMIDALKSGKYDLDKVALAITQTGGGCRASNYIHLLRKALKKSGFGHIPVMSLNLSGLEKGNGIKITLPMLKRSATAIIYGDLLMLLNNQSKAYEINKGDSEDLLNEWLNKLSAEFQKGKGFRFNEMKSYLGEIVKTFMEIPKKYTQKVKVGIVGEIYVKFSSLGNNNLEKFLDGEDCEIMVPGLLGFIMYCVENGVIDYKIYGSKFLKSKIFALVNEYIGKIEGALIDAVKNSNFTPPSPFKHLKTLTKDVVGMGCKMGEGWLLPAEMVELIGQGYENIICAQPFGCLPNHIVGKGVISNIKEIYPNANIVPIDYDPGATKVNQENRIKLMLSVAKEKLNLENKGEELPMLDELVNNEKLCMAEIK